MPYQNEFSKQATLSKMLDNPALVQTLKSMKIDRLDKSSLETIDSLVYSRDVEPIESSTIKCVFSFDGSKSTVNLKTGFPNAELGFIRVGHVFCDLNKLKNFENNKFPHPGEYEDIFVNTTLDAIIPGFNVSGRSIQSPRDFFRLSVFEFFKNSKDSFVDFLHDKANKNAAVHSNYDSSLINELVELLKVAGDFSVPHPCEVCNQNGKTIKKQDFFNFSDSFVDHAIECNCKTDKKTVYLTDLLGLHEILSDSGGNEGLYNQFMSIVEKIMLMNLLRGLSKFFKKELWSSMAFVMDGPLAIYNINWFSQSIMYALSKYQKDGFVINLIGLEKTGAFVDHLQSMNMELAEDKTLNDGFMFYLNDNYIKKFIKMSNSKAPYGMDTYFGKKFFYKNRNGYLFVVNQVYLSEEDRLNYINAKNDLSYIKMQKSLKDILWLLENFSSSRYENGLSFVSFAHENVSISNNDFSQYLMKEFVNQNIL